MPDVASTSNHAEGLIELEEKWLQYEYKEGYNTGKETYRMILNKTAQQGTR
jgi:hypothetical protein